MIAHYILSAKSRISKYNLKHFEDGMKSIKITYPIAVFCIFCFFLPGRAFAEKEITILSSNYPPHIYMENGEIKGIRVELLTELFKRMGYKYKPEIMPWDRAIVMIKKGRVDGICSIRYEPDGIEFRDQRSGIGGRKIRR